jgi:uncharacterized membrane protein (UPF0182 family)
VVAYENQVVMDETLDGALTTMFGGATRQRAVLDQPGISAAATAGADDPQLQAQMAEARRHFQSAVDAQRNGDWAKYGEEIKALGQILERFGNRK